MSKLTKPVEEQRKRTNNDAVLNFMDGVSYSFNPLDTLKMVSASSIFGEPQYYRDGLFSPARYKDGIYKVMKLFAPYSIMPDELDGMKTSELMENVIDAALAYDYKATIEWAVTLREEFNMRMNPQIIMVRAAMNHRRQKFNEEYPGLFSKLQKRVMQRADEPITQLEYYLFKNGNKKNLPNILKRNWASRIESSSLYELHKYKNSGIGMIDTIRICHANSPVIDELMKTGSITVEDRDNTWEAKRAAKTSWTEILSSVKMGHMALLRNLRGIFTEIDDFELCKSVMHQLKEGVKNGKQFPFRYFTALRMIENSTVNHSGLILDTLEECMDTACENMPKLKGKTMCLSDNSGSAWGTFNSEYGSVTIAEIDNLSSLITARNSDEGYVGIFGDNLIVKPVSKRNGLLSQCKALSDVNNKEIGMSTENGIWLFFRDAIDKNEHWDNIFIYSDQQAGHGGLYGTEEGEKEYVSRGFNVKEESYLSCYIDAAALIAEYRAKVNPKVNVFSVQTAGYNVMLVPEYGYRTNILYGWTGKELLFADTMIRFWDKADNNNASK